MTTQTASDIAPQAPEANAPMFNIQRAYLKGTSFEMPHGPAIFLGQHEIGFSLNLTPKRAELAPGVFEIVLHATLTATDSKDGKVWFLLEIEQAGIFELRNIPAEHVEGLLAIRCPTILHNYLRVQISDTLSRATLPPFMLPEFDWGVVTQQAQAEQQAAIADRVVH